MKFVVMAIAAVSWSGSDAGAKTFGTMHPYARFKVMDEGSKRAYIHDVRRCLFELEMGLGFGYDLAENSAARLWQEWFGLPEAIAADDLPLCMIGKKTFSMKRSGRRRYCPTTESTCNGGKGFQCGALDGGACVDRYPITTISARCDRAGASLLPDETTYRGIQGAVDAIADDCRTNRFDRHYRRNCEQFQKRLSDLQKQYPAGASQVLAKDGPTPGGAPVSSPPALPRGSARPDSAGGSPVPTAPVKEQGAGNPAAGLPDGPPSGSVPAGPASGAAGPSSEVAAMSAGGGGTPQDPCKGLFGLIVEGTSSKSGAHEDRLQRSAATWANGFSSLASYTGIVPPAGGVGKVVADDPGPLGDLKKSIESSGAENICSSEAPSRLADYIYGRTKLVRPGPANPEYRVGDKNVVDGAKVGLESVDPTTSDGLSKSELIKRMAAQREKCRGNPDQVVMISIKGNGSRDCSIDMGQDKKLKAEDVRRNLIEPLTRAGAKVVVNFDSSFGGCFVNSLKAQLKDTPVCLASAVRPFGPGYMADGIIKGTYEDSYPGFLSSTKNPLKAHLCASLQDPLNAPVIAGGTAAPPSASGSSPASSPSKTEASSEIDGLGQKFGVSDLGKACGSGKSSFGGVDGVDSGKLKALMKCDQFRDAMASATPGDGRISRTTFEKLFGAVSKDMSPPGLENLRALAQDSGELARLKGSCDIDLAQYASPETPVQGEPGGSGAGDSPGARK